MGVYEGLYRLSPFTGMADKSVVPERSPCPSATLRDREVEGKSKCLLNFIRSLKRRGFRFPEKYHESRILEPRSSRVLG